jgi:hypothetical protein
MGNSDIQALIGILFDQIKNIDEGILYEQAKKFVKECKKKLSNKQVLDLFSKTNQDQTIRALNLFGFEVDIVNEDNFAISKKGEDAAIFVTDNRKYGYQLNFWHLNPNKSEWIPHL